MSYLGNVTVFAKDVITKDHSTLRIIKGFVAEDDEVYGLLQSNPRWKRSVAFRMKP